MQTVSKVDDKTDDKHYQSFK